MNESLGIKWNLNQKDIKIFLDYVISKYNVCQFTSLCSHCKPTEEEWDIAYKELTDSVNTEISKYINPSNEFIETLLKWDYFENSSRDDIIDYCLQIFRQEIEFLDETKKQKKETIKNGYRRLTKDDIYFLSKGIRTPTFLSEVTKAGYLFFTYRYTLNEETKKILKKELDAVGRIRLDSLDLEDFAIYNNDECKIAYCTHEKFILCNFTEKEIKELESLGFEGFEKD